MVQTVGVVGLGNMGLAMATRLAGAGLAVAGFDRDPARVALAVAAGVGAPGSLAAVFAQAGIIVLSLPLARDVEAVLGGPGDLPPGRRVVVDTSTSDPATSRRLAARLGTAGHGFLDAPVSGGPAGAAAGSLTFMVGGAAEDLDAARPAIAPLAGRILHVGPSGAGNVGKLVNNLLVAAHLLTNAEAMRLAAAAGVDAASVLAVVNAATGRSAVSEVFYPRWILPGSHDSGFSAGLMRKDVSLALALAADSGVELTLGAQVARLWRDSGLADADDFTRVAELARD